MMSTFTAASIIPAYGEIAEDLGLSIQGASYLTSLQIAIIGGAPLIWRPLSARFGRRPIFILSLICSLVGNIGCAKSPSYGTMGLCRAIVAFFICPPTAIGSGVVTEVFFKRERAMYMGIWTLMITIGVPLSPLIFGFVANSINYRWIYWILAMVCSSRRTKPNFCAGLLTRLDQWRTSDSIHPFRSRDSIYSSGS
jgi:MFS family permease